MRERLRREYFRRVKMVLRTELCCRNKVLAINGLALPVLTYSFGFIYRNRSKLIPITFTFTPLDTRKPAIKTNIGGCPRRSYYHKSFVEGRSCLGGTVHCLSHPNERLPTSTVKEQIFLLTKLKTRRQCTCTFTYFSLTLALSSPLQTF